MTTDELWRESIIARENMVDGAHFYAYLLRSVLPAVNDTGPVCITVNRTELWILETLVEWARESTGAVFTERELYDKGVEMLKKRGFHVVESQPDDIPVIAEANSLSESFRLRYCDRWLSDELLRCVNPAHLTFCWD